MSLVLYVQGRLAEVLMHQMVLEKKGLVWRGKPEKSPLDQTELGQGIVLEDTQAEEDT